MAPTYKLTYFDILGLGEPIRFLFAYGGLDFEDNRITYDEWPRIKSSMPFGKMPLFEENGKKAIQSFAIGRYLAKKLKLRGNDDWEDLEIDGIVDTLADFRKSIALYAYQKDEDFKAKYKQELFGTTVPLYTEQLDAQAKRNGGYLVGGHLTWADLVFVGLIDYINFMLEKDLLNEAPNLRKVKENVLAVPNVKAYMESRPTHQVIVKKYLSA